MQIKRTGNNTGVKNLKTIKMFVDQRELRSPVVRELERLGTAIDVKTLVVGDYILSDRVGVERKTVNDFLSTLVDGKRNVFNQLSDLRDSFERPILIIEGSGLYTRRKIHPNAIRGVLASIAVDFGIPIVMTEGAGDTAAFLHVIAKREQESIERYPSLHGKRSSMTLKAQQEYIVSSIPSVGPVIAKNLLHYFGSVQDVVVATKDELVEVDGVGPKIADKIRRIVGSRYEE